MVDLTKIKVGDEVTVRAKVVALEPNKLCPEPIRIHGGSWINEKDILTHTPASREFKPGDRVSWLPNTFAVWTIEAIKDGQAWLRFKNDWHTAKISDLRHADD